MQRPKLEVTSWVAGVVGAIAAVIALFFQLREPKQPQVSASPVLPASAPAPTTAAAHPPAPATDPHFEYRTNLKSGFEAAKRLGNFNERDEAILRVVRSAIKIDYYAFAFEASRSLNNFYAKDNVAAAVACHHAHRAEYEDARSAALAIQDFRTREDSLKQIARLATTKPGEGENGRCPARC